MTALQREPTLFIPVHECSSPAAPGDVDRLIEGHRLTQTALSRDPLCSGSPGQGLTSPLYLRFTLVHGIVDLVALSVFFFSASASGLVYGLVPSRSGASLEGKKIKSIPTNRGRNFTGRNVPGYQTTEAPCVWLENVS